MLGTLLVCLLSAALVFVSYGYLAYLQTFPNDGFRPLRTSGPVLLGSADGANLDGLTLIRAVKMPALNLVLPGIGRISIKNSTSEMVFQTLRVRDMSIGSEDVATKETKLDARVDARFTGLCVARLQFTLNMAWLGLPKRTYESRTTGSLLVHLEDLHTILHLQLGKNAQAHSRLKHTRFSFVGGQFKQFAFTGMPYPDLVTRLPLWLTLQPVANFLLQAFLDSQEMRAGMTSLWARAHAYFDTESWQSTGEHVRQSPIPTVSPSAATLLRTHFALAGRTSVVDIGLPDHIPSLYPEGGKRAKLQSWNMITGEVKFEITKNIIKKLAFDRAVLELNSPAYLEDLPLDLATANVLVCRLEGFRTEMSSHFALYANTSKAIKMVTRVESLGEHGTSTAIVKARRLELVFALFVEESGVTVKALRTDDFDSVEVSIEGLRSKKDDWVNGILKVVRPQIARVAGLMIKRFLELEVKKGTDGIEKVEAALLMQGIEIPGMFRLRPFLEKQDGDVKVV